MGSGEESSGAFLLGAAESGVCPQKSDDAAELIVTDEPARPGNESEDQSQGGWQRRRASVIALTAAALVLFLAGAAAGVALHARSSGQGGGPSSASAAMPARTLSFPEDRPWKLMILGDVHFGEAEDTDWGPYQDVKSLRVINAVLDAENPDFVVLLGDQVTGENLVNATNATDYLRQILDPLAARGIPFASAYGNHDISVNLAREKIFEYEHQYPNCFTRRSDPEAMPGVSNFVLDVASSDPTKQEPAFRLIFLDSNGITGLSPHGVSEVDWVTSKQVQFLQSVLQGAPVPSYVFVHIPPQPFQELQAAPEEHGCVGLRDEPGLAVQRQDEGLWDALHGSANVLAVFSGHCHGSGWCCKAPRPAQALTACFARHSGYGGYGSWDRGARVLLVDEHKPTKFKSWVRMENGTVMDKFERE